jgi:hypothetical protein
MFFVWNNFSCVGNINNMATYKDPVQCFAPLEVIERLLGIRAELGFPEAVFLLDSSELADCFDAHGFDIYAFDGKNQKMDYGTYTAPMVPGGDSIHNSFRVH